MRFINWIKREFLHVFPAFLFFFAAFNVVNIIEALFLRSKGIPPVSFYTVFIAAAVVAKVLVVIDHLPFINAFPNRPLIFNVIWKTFIYEVTTFVVRFLMRVVPSFLDTESFISGYIAFKSSFDSMQFLSIQLLYLVLFFTFVISHELIIAIGAVKVRKMFFGR